MLVCNISMRPLRRAIAAELAEAAAALDAPGPGNVVFATLVDDPASVGDIVDAYLGEIMLEAASASSTVDANIPIVYAADITEATTAAATPDGTVVPAVTSVTWDSATVSAVTLSGGDLVATNTGTTSADQGARVATASGKTSGKYYFEVAITTGTSGANVGIGVGTTSSTYTGLGNNGAGGNMVFTSGNIYANGTFTGLVTDALSVGTVAGIAVDLDNRKAWFRKAPSGSWNAISGTANDPASNTGGVTIPAGTMVPFVTFGGTGGAANNVRTAKFGATAFTGAVPSGFTAGWPA
jgi:hypothetical protein